MRDFINTKTIVGGKTVTFVVLFRTGSVGGSFDSAVSSGSTDDMGAGKFDHATTAKVVAPSKRFS